MNIRPIYRKTQHTKRRLLEIMSDCDEKHINIPYETGESTPYPPAYGDVTQPYARYAISVQTTRLTKGS